MRLMLLGPPGAGKGTQTQRICEEWRIPQIATGDILRRAIQEKTAVGLKAKQVMDRGQLVSDDIILDLVKERLERPDCQQGYLFDGVPRTLAQAESLRNMGIYFDGVVDLQVPDEMVILRLTGRRIHPGSGRTYHLSYNPPKIPGVDDLSGEPLIQRSDDSIETVTERLRVYHELTQPLRDYYQTWAKSGEAHAPKWIAISGLGKVDEVFSRIQQGLKT